MIYAVREFGFAAVGKYYLLPYMIVNYHLVLITYLQHTDVFIPHFRGKVISNNTTYTPTERHRWSRAAALSFPHTLPSSSCYALPDPRLCLCSVLY